MEKKQDLNLDKNIELQEEENAIEIIEASEQEQEIIVPKIPLKEKIQDFKIVKQLKGKVWPVLLPFMFVMVILVLLPLLGIIIFSIIQPTNNSFMFRVSLENFVKLLSNGAIMLVIGLTLLYAFIASVVAIALAYPVALFMANLKNKLLAKNTWIILTLPIWISMILKILGLQSLFYILAPTALGTPIAIIIGMVYMFLPFAISPIYNALENIDPIYHQAALDLKASRTKAFWHITFRQSLPGVFTAFTLVLVQAATSLLIVRYMGDGKINLITTIIESYFFKGSDFGFGATIAVVLAVLLFLLMYVTNYLSKKFEVRGSKKWKNSSNQVTLG